MRSRVASLIAILAAVSVAWVPVTMAQQAPAPPAPAPAMAEKTIEGKIKSVDPTGKSVTLADDTKLMIPDTVKVSRADLQAGATVKVSYEEKGGQKVVTKLEIKQ